MKRIAGVIAVIAVFALALAPQALAQGGLKWRGSGGLQCHGARDKLAPGVADALKELYPQDQATGYAVGDLRGAVSVKIPIASGQ